jgi:hypothetical protein
MLLKKDNQTKVIYEVDERPATEEEIAEIKTFFPKQNKPTNQGLSEGNEVQMRVVKLENIIAIGGETWAKEV